MPGTAVSEAAGSPDPSATPWPVDGWLSCICGATATVASATLVRALRGVFEGNEVAVAMGSNKRFKVHCGGVVDNDHLFSLRIEDILPMQRIRVTIQVFMHTHEYRTVLQKPPNLTTDNRNVHVHSPLHSTSSTGTLDNRQEPWGTCELDEFLDMVSSKIHFETFTCFIL